MEQITFIHTADWQLGKPFGSVQDSDKRATIRKERIEAIKRIGEVATRENAEFVLVAGDLFDSITPDKSTVSAACSAIGRIPLPVFVIPGNHDHGGPGSIWEQEFFQEECRQLAPNLKILLDAKPEVLENAVILPCPLLSRTVHGDPAAWLHNNSEILKTLPENLPRIVLAHGSIQSFDGSGVVEEESAISTNLIDLDKLEALPIDYVALGDWHGTKQVGEKSWYSGTHEIDRFPKGGQDPGNVLVVQLSRGTSLKVEKFRTTRLNWYSMSFHFTSDDSLNQFRSEINKKIGNRGDEILIQLELTGSLGLEAYAELEKILNSLEARLVRLKVIREVQVAPTEDEITELAQRPNDPLIASVAQALIDQIAQDGDDTQTVQLALRLLHAACHQEEEKSK